MYKKELQISNKPVDQQIQKWQRSQAINRQININD